MLGAGMGLSIDAVMAVVPKVLTRRTEILYRTVIGAKNADSIAEESFASAGIDAR